MKCTNCEMVDQLPGTNCSHCGRPIPEAEPVFAESVDESEEGAETPATEAEKTEDSGGPAAETPAAETEANPAEAGDTPAEEAPVEDLAEVELEKGHVDNVGDEAETPVP